MALMITDQNAGQYLALLRLQYTVIKIEFRGYFKLMCYTL